MLTAIATILAGLVGTGLIAMGGNAVARPRAAAGIGIPDPPVDNPTRFTQTELDHYADTAVRVFTAAYRTTSGAAK